MVLALCFALVSCGSADNSKTSGGETEKKENTESTDTTASKALAGKKIGVSMPTRDLQRWVQDGDNMKSKLEEAGYEVELQYGGNKVAEQVSQIENMIAQGCNALVISAIEGESLSDVLAKAKEANVRVIAYDRLIMNTDAVDYYATFDNRLVGTLQGQYIEEKLDLKNAKGPFNIELFTGDSADNNVNFFFGGAMDVLQPYIDSGKLVVPSGQSKMEQCYTPGWATEDAQNRMEDIISKNYSGGETLHAVLSSNDSIAVGVANALASTYTGDYPVLTGQDCDIAAMKNILAKKQSMSIFKDTRLLAEQVVTMIKALGDGSTVPVNDEKTYDNGTGIIPTFLCEPVFADIDNYKSLLIESGYYKEDELKS
jgi:putative multiple sugar transport system substrate-binding protein